MTYHALREFADSWALAGMTIFFVGVVLFVLFRPKARDHARDAKMIPFKEDDVDGR
ncbi:FixQ1 nitrogen fixation protein [Aureimonas sp. SA4125]|uniref:cbb3-type cytochrome oxidase subunit 3 n=1 Tax=Aureimonas sp. SA4125 TaxID=2826993 RepID=UPI001CC4716B|nr:cbb3-type cytochrome c oxidase subunit 3 [Aureimonas sp. SA4125]BDA84174.1 FixQ1 nitrogen fixation protein [Aureimonas sp. SA4125]